ncbi:MAG: chemotaxis protein CheW [Acidobacteria bacterium]|jgi:purine-binding chemotaxis protein CheW|nr:chemotaxis protein CheW [Acidobacteriota bacterium]
MESLFAARKPQAAPEVEALYLGFAVAGQDYALPIGCVREILKVPQIHAFPKVPSFVKGVIDLRGAILPVVDLKERLGLGAVDRAKGRIIVLVPNHQPMGLLVDKAVEVFPCPGELLKPKPDLLSKAPVPFLAGIISREGTLYYALDPKLLLTPREFEVLETHEWAKPKAHERQE